MSDVARAAGDGELQARRAYERTPGAIGIDRDAPRERRTRHTNHNKPKSCNVTHYNIANKTTTLKIYALTPILAAMSASKITNNGNKIAPMLDIPPVVIVFLPLLLPVSPFALAPPA